MRAPTIEGCLGARQSCVFMQLPVRRSAEIATAEVHRLAMTINNMTAIKSFLYLILTAGLGAWYFPLVLLPKNPQVETGVFAYLAFPLWLIGGLEILWCFWDFTFKGRGTPLPIDPPKELVMTGPYRYVRNPIYLGVLIIVIGYFFWFKSIWMIVYAIIAFLVCHLFIVFYEERTLKKKFGTAYENYCKSVPRWIPKFNDFRRHS